ncbi:MAG: glycosyltransferase [Chloroflexota bacterium]
MPVIRVLDIIDGLAGGGSERWVYDIARLSDPARVRHRVTTVHPDRGRFVYAESLRRLGSYGEPWREGDRTLLTGAVVRRSARFADDGRLTRALRLAWHGGIVFPTGGYRALREWISFRPEVIHGHTFHGFVFALQLARLTRLPLVHTVPSLFAQMEDAGHGWLPRLYARAHPRVARFFTAYPDELRRVGVPVSKIQEIQGVVDSSRIESALTERASHRSRIRATLGIGPGAPVALSVGRLHHSKGHELAAAAVALASQHVRDLQWILLGEGDDRASIEARVRELRIGDRTHMAGFVTDVLPFYAAADLYLRTPLFEAENQASYQAMGMGLPVAGFDTAQSTDLLGRIGHGMLVPSGNSSRLADAIVDLLSAADRGLAFGARGQAYARAHLGVDRTIEDFTSTYEGLGAL